MQILHRPLDYPKIWQLFRRVELLDSGNFRIELALGGLTEVGDFSLAFSDDGARLALLKGSKLRELELRVWLTPVGLESDLHSTLLVKPTLPVPASILREISAKCEGQVRSDLRAWLEQER